jgi:hypothetical protein
VGDGVVDLPGDPQPLGVHPPPCLLLPGPLGPLRPLQGLGRQDPPGADRLAKRRHHDRRADAEEHPPGRVERPQLGGEQPPDEERGLAGRQQLQ